MAELRVHFRAHLSKHTSFSAVHSASVNISRVPFSFHGEAVPNLKGNGELSRQGRQRPLLLFLLMLSPWRPSQAAPSDAPAESSHRAPTGCLKGTRSAQHSALRGLLVREFSAPAFVGGQECSWGEDQPCPD